MNRNSHYILDHGHIRTTALAASLLLLSGCDQRSPEPFSGGMESVVAVAEKFRPKSDETETVAVLSEKTKTLLLGGGVQMVFVLIPPGSFQMGSTSGHEDEKPVHTVTFSDAFYMSRYEVTQEQWKTVMGSQRGRFEGSNRPVERVRWSECRQFAEQLNGRTSGWIVRLPTEAEWEYACRAESTTRYSFGDDDAHLSEYAWYMENAGGTTHTVGQLRPNAFGLYDMHGNVSEWCLDTYHPDYVGAPANGQVWSGGMEGYRVLRGGSWRSNARVCRSANRLIDDFDDLGNDYGFRLVLAH
jgi:formylglycine-generating enzyme required for sulfatase activity